MSASRLHKKVFLSSFLDEGIYYVKETPVKSLPDENQERENIVRESEKQEQQPSEEPIANAEQETNKAVTTDTEAATPEQNKDDEEIATQANEPEATEPPSDYRIYVILQDPYTPESDEISPKFREVIFNIFPAAGFEQEKIHLMKEENAPADLPEKDENNNECFYLIFSQNQEDKTSTTHIFRTDFLENVAMSRQKKRPLWYHLKNISEHVFQAK